MIQRQWQISFTGFCQLEQDRQDMHKNTSICAVLITMALLVTGCSTSGEKVGVPTPETDQTALSVEHIIAPGDRLSDIALKYTGEVGQWQAIARFNRITDPRTLRIGDVITIPGSMMTGTSADQESANNNAASSQADTNVSTAGTGTLGLKRDPSQTVDAEDVTVAPVTTNRTFELQPISASELDQQPNASTSAPQVRVVGTYYPKGVYQQPASYSRLMMRVAPGTVFELDQEVNDWYKVIIGQGYGYLRQIDGKIVPSEPN